MENSSIIIIGLIVFVILSFLFYKSMRKYVDKSYGKKWAKLWGNKLYFWQSLLFMSLLCTAIVLYILDALEVVTF